MQEDQPEKPRQWTQVELDEIAWAATWQERHPPIIVEPPPED